MYTALKKIKKIYKNKLKDDTDYDIIEKIINNYNASDEYANFIDEVYSQLETL